MTEDDIPKANRQALEEAFHRATEQNIRLLNDPHMLEAKEVLGRLSISKGELWSRVGQHKILALTIMGLTRFPDWQLTPTILDSPAWPKVLKILSTRGQWSQFRFFQTPQPSLGGSVPVDLLREGKGSRLFKAAQVWVDAEQGGH